MEMYLEFWTTLPFLDFRLYFPGNDEWFINFVNTTLRLRELTDVQTFRLSCHNLLGRQLYSMSIRSWILYVLQHNPKVFDIAISSVVKIPIGVFTCSSLEDVSLSIRGWRPSTEVIELPCLRRLYLQDIYVNQNFVEKLFCGCPILESLHLDRCILEFSAIISQSLKYLHVQNGCDAGKGRKTLGLINAPNLLSFYYGDCPNYIGHRTLLYTPSLTDVTLCIGCYYHQFSNGKNNFFVGISNTQNLKLMGHIIKEVLENELLGCPEFPNLKNLFVDELCLSCHFNLLASFMDHFPNLEKLSLLHRGCICEMSKEHGNQESLKISPFQCKQLKTVGIQFCNSDDDFPRVLKYLQKSVLNLEVQICMATFPLEKCLYANWCYCCSHR